MPLTPDLLAILLAAVLAAAILRGVTGFGFALAAVPVMSFVVSPAQAVTITILLQAMIGLRDLVAQRAHLELPAIGWLSLGATIGTAPGVWLLGHLSADAMRLVVAGVVLAGLVLLLRAPAAMIRPGAGPAIGAGLASGLFSGLAAMPGPPAVTYFLGAATPALRARASLMVFFFLTSLMALPGLGLSGQIDRASVIVAACSLPVLACGTWLGGLAFRRLGEGGYRQAAIWLLAVSALVSAGRGLAGYL